MASKDNQVVSVLMIGSPRVGKSSVLASMLYSLDNVSAETGVSFAPDEATGKLMKDRLAALKKIFELYQPGQEFETQSGMKGNESYAAATDERTTYRFSLSIRAKEIRAKQQEEVQQPICDVEFTDIPGEDLTQRQTDVVARLQDCGVIILAIDSVALMERDEYGYSFNEEINYTAQIHQIMMNAYTQTKKHQHQLVLLVPLKCEKYYWERGGMKRLNARLKEEYQNLLSFLAANDTFSVAITPILTLGDVQFSRFAGGDSYAPLYQFRLKDGNGCAHTPAYTPAFCAQPLYYIAAYVLSLTEKLSAEMDVNGQKQKNGKREPLSVKLTVFFILWAAGREGRPLSVKYNLAKLAAKIRFRGDGYELLQDKLNMQENIRNIRWQAKKVALRA